MTHTKNDNSHLQNALEQASKLSAPTPAQGVTAAWTAHATHVGDLSVLALALRA
jgi:hypothetical protein